MGTLDDIDSSLIYIPVTDWCVRECHNAYTDSDHKCH